MPGRRLSIGLRATLFLTVALFGVGTLAVAETEKELYSFGTNGMDGAYPLAGLIFDGAGNLYGTTVDGGAYGAGTVFELAHKAGAGWTEKVSHSFGNGKDGAFPYAGLIFDGSGNLYGTTYEGGTGASGTVFELTPKAGGGWTEKVIYSFNSNGKDGEHPYAGLIFAAGHLFGTTYLGGTENFGTVFELTPKAGGGWTEKVLHSFGHGKDGALPRAGLIIDAAGDLYGTTVDGGVDGLGAVFELTPKAGGKWAEKVLHNFKGQDGEYPDAGLIFDHAGNLYGATQETIFELTHKAGGWTEKVLHNSGSVASLIFGAAGNLYGTTTYGGPYDAGTVFELMREAGGRWTYTTLFGFMGGEFGAYPYGGLTLGTSGDMYGTTYQGGAYNYGIVFEMTPQLIQ